MDLDDVINLLKKKGFSDTYNILLNFRKYKAEFHEFYKEFNKISYYNSFLRIKEELIKKKLININKSQNKKYISLSELGINVYNKLIELNDILTKS